MSAPMILVVDDMPNARETVAALLRTQPYELQFAASAAEALQAVEGRRPDTILLDVMMPDMSGFELCRRLRARAETRHTPIVLITALESKKHVAEGLEAGADDFLTKPVNGLELRARVRTMLRLNRQYEELKALLRTRDEVASMLVHDMRSPLTGMLMHSEVLRRAALDPKPARSAEAIGAQAKRLQRFVDDLLLVAKIEHDAFALSRVDTDPFELLRKVTEGYRPLAEASGIELTVRGPEDAPGTVPLDTSLFERVIDNLLSNAIKFSPAGSAVTVACRTAAGEDGAVRLRVEVADEGPGIPPADRERVFEKFAIGPRDQTKQQTGLGLAFCRKVVEAHGGTIAIEDAPSGGSLFVVTL